MPSDHLNCPIGSYTHAIDLPPERAGELEQTFALMTSVGYVRMEEVPAIPRLPRTPAFTYYAPLAATVVDPDVVIFAGRPGRLMRLQEASARAGAASQLPLLGRPTCMALPAAMTHGSVVSHRLHRQSSLHGPGRGRALPHDSGQAADGAGCCHRDGERHA